MVRRSFEREYIRMICIGDYVYVRTSVTRRKAVGEITYINHLHGWVTVEINAMKGKYREAVFVRDIEGLVPRSQRNKLIDSRSLWADTSDDWLSEWDEGKIDAEVRKMQKKRKEK